MRDGAAAFVRQELRELAAAVDRLAAAEHVAALTAVADATAGALRAGGRVLFCGNGGSAGDAQHLAAELVGRQHYDRGALAGIALTADTSVLTAVGNDYGFDHVFARQVAALGRPGDVLFGLSTSGASRNVIEALAAARAGGLTTVAFTGEKPGEMADADFVVAMPAGGTAQVQELHLAAGHIVCGLVERALFPRDDQSGFPKDDQLGCHRGEQGLPGDDQSGFPGDDQSGRPPVTAERVG
ncbi:D-sedoheptulose-7-phosphate isomerase [Rugosimonospora africana]|nr:SIS domain-containing protein [Rugosimonospora africana]